MIDPSSIITPEVQMFVFGVLTYIVTQLSKRFHVDKELIWKAVCVFGTIAYCALTWDYSENFFAQLFGKAAGIIVVSAGLWHLIKKNTGVAAQEDKAILERGKELGREEVSNS